MAAAKNKNSKKQTLQEKIDALANRVVAERGRPLLLLFYPDRSSMTESGIFQLTLAMKKEGLRRGNPLDSLDILLQTLGGSPNAAYRLAQVVRNVTKEAYFLVPEFAYSAGTLLCLSGDEIVLGENAVLSPFDIRLVRDGNIDDGDPDDTYTEEKPDEEVELVGIDHFIQVAKQARMEMERGFRLRGWKTSKTRVESDMLCEMVREIGALTMARFFREKNVSQAYATQLLKSYMFSEGLRPDRMDRLLRRLISEAPSHAFAMDYHLCLDVGLKVLEMTDELSDITQQLTKILTEHQRDDTIFPIVARERLPLFQFVPYTESSEEIGPPIEAEEVSEEVTDGRAQKVSG